MAGAMILGFGGALSEVADAGRWADTRRYTRSLQQLSRSIHKGEIVLSLALGTILIGIATVISVIVKTLLQGIDGFLEAD